MVPCSNESSTSLFRLTETSVQPPNLQWLNTPGSAWTVVSISIENGDGAATSSLSQLPPLCVF